VIFSDTPVLARAAESLAFLQADIVKCVEMYNQWISSIYNNIGLKTSMAALDGSLESVVRQLYPLTSVVSRRSVFIPTTSGWTAYLDNGHQGTDGSAIAHLATIIPCKTVHARHTPPNDHGDHPGTILEIFGPEQREWLNVVRSIAAVSNDGRWEFHTGGEVQPFEDVGRYLERRIRDRFTGEMLARYLQAMEIDAYNVDFYMPSGQSAFLIEGIGPSAPGMREFPLEL
jgi:hypothetical protein